MEMFCDNCGFEEDDLYEIDGAKYCKDCLDSLQIVTIHTTESYYVNGEWFDKYENAVKYAGGKVVSNE